MSKILINLFVLVGLSGCARLYVHKYENIDLENKTITVPTGSNGLKGGVKQALKNEGWFLSIDRAPSRIKGSFGEKTDIKMYDKFKTKYRIKINSVWSDYCVFPLTSIGEDFVHYEISVVNNNTGIEVFAMNGRDCVDNIVEDFMIQINKQELIEE